ncbi:MULTISPECIES: sodium-extruding oxaloacetate decarboxylase subunit alpha [unclassified Colwellia]|uniref:sodium-extruding oxaloacetate decarboxylase subunit alpha n=1 Tax=unclassified Colwellia TaxID=196834 RepID=UPI0015F6EC12|nr:MULTISPECIES: sodium-extruding oxaloacetate decarboxylase subunit alpha [unclassified Colwellia]MBA6223583.1 sodium-extruding oxaloacetate decarboxylase subunit alpha [Colwellia sp. MB3u-45]MBA6269060.1 sodium-extruding oxaloacetate decarboxylase subunit alpha [Colwellia sp. MB3u-43]MBA6289741.1 sodium-extruding oxaloacetate decarboxylase subunit alpha [Colwellia sp. MB3u-4]MBA6295051.1 sodium-extruding oxaloacetate decarboxylase subunit alpha [Colwellia sp. MB02u-9]MBA6320854.1 sodium-extr
MTKPLGITEVVLRDGHQSLLATRLRLEDMLPIAAKMDEIGYWSIESWGGATFDSCIRYLGEDPWERLRALKKAMPKTKQQMLFRGQNILGYRHYADDVVEKFVERAHVNGIDVFRIFDAMNDVRNLQTSIKAAVKVGAHAQGTLSYTESPVHTLEGWLTMAKQLEDMGAHSLCIKDMAGLLKPYDAAELISRLKETVALPIALHCHATTGLSVATHMKAIDADIDVIDTAISSMSMTYGHSPTETIVSIVEGTARDTGLDMLKLAEVATYFREVREKYAQFEGSLRGIDARILVAQVPGGMLTNMESQLKEQGAADKLDEVLTEIPKVRKDLGYIPLVTPTSQIVGTQAVLNVLTGERYKSITKETAGVLKGEYGKTAAPVDAELQARVLDGKAAITCRPADLLDPEMDKLSVELQQIAEEKNITLAEDTIDDVLTYALFPQIGLKFLTNRNNPDAFEPAPTKASAKSATAAPATSSTNTGPESYAVSVDGKVFDVVVAPGGSIDTIAPASKAPAASSSDGEALKAPLAGNIFKVLVNEGDEVEAGEVVIIMEAMKMETEIRAITAGEISAIHTKEGDSVAVGDILLSLV